MGIASVENALARSDVLVFMGRGEEWVDEVSCWGGERIQ